jgi:hypothetical protein
LARLLHFETAPLEATDGLTSAKAVPLKCNVPLARLQSEKYEWHVSVFDPTAQKFNFWRRRWWCCREVPRNEM